MPLNRVNVKKNLQGVQNYVCRLILIYVFSIGTAIGDPSPWVTGYLPAYHQSENGTIYILSDSDYEKLTHLSHHGPYVNQDGSFSYQPTLFSDVKAIKAVQQAHQHDVPILLCIVAWYDNYIEAINDSLSRNKLVDNILNLVDKANYDGVDVDLEPVMSAYIPGIENGNPYYIQFVNQLYDSLQERTSSLLHRSLLLTAPMNGYAGPVFAQVYDKFDQINIMTYDLVSPDWGFPVWHDSPVYSGGYMIYGKPAPSIEREVEECLSAGVPADKVGIGVSCDAFRWKGGSGTSTGGATAPRQQWLTAPSWTRFAYKDMISTVYQEEYYRWDDSAEMSYLSIDKAGSADDEFWSYNDEKSCKSKVEFVREQALGGLIIWELGSGYVASRPQGDRLPQLEAIYESIIKPTAIAAGQERITAPFSLKQNYPNPFNASTSIEYFLTKESYVNLSIYNTIGQLIETLVSDKEQAGSHKVLWPKSGTVELKFSSGVYFYKLEADGMINVQKMIMID
jgi:chitinase